MIPLRCFVFNCSINGESGLWWRNA